MGSLDVVCLATCTCSAHSEKGFSMFPVVGPQVSLPASGVYIGTVARQLACTCSLLGSFAYLRRSGHAFSHTR